MSSSGRFQKLARWSALGIAGLLIQDTFHGLALGDWRVAAWTLLAVSLLIVALTWEPIGPWLPRMALSRGAVGEGLWINIRAPQRRGMRRLRRETAAFVHDVNQHQSAAFDRIPQPELDEAAKAMNKTSTPEAREREWVRQREEIIAREDARRLARADQLWQRARSLVVEYERRGLLTPAEAAGLDPQGTFSKGGLVHVARRLEGLAGEL